MKGEHLPVYQGVATDQGRFFLSPLPIGGTYVVIASRGHNKQISRPVRLDGTRATERIELRLAKPTTASGRVVGPDGQPLRGMPVTLNLKHPQAESGWDPPTLTDREGRFRFDDLSSEIGHYRAVLDFRKDYQPAGADLNPGGAPVEVRLKSGRVVAGRILDAATGWPIPGVEIYAHLPHWREGERYAYEAEGRDRRPRAGSGSATCRTDPVSLNDRNGLNWQPPGGSPPRFEPDRGGTFEVRATLPAWSPLRPAKAAGK